MSISKFRFIGDGGSPCINNGFDPASGTFLSDYRSLLELVVGKLIGEGAFLNDGPPRPCIENPTDLLYEIITTPCVAQGAWTGTVNFGSGAQNTVGWYFNYCPGQTLCTRQYRACTQPDGTIKTTLVKQVGGDDCADNYGYPQVPNPVYPFPPNNTVVVPAGGTLAATSPTVTIYTDQIGDFYKCTPACEE